MLRSSVPVLAKELWAMADSVGVLWCLLGCSKTSSLNELLLVLLRLVSVDLWFIGRSKDEKEGTKSGRKTSSLSLDDKSVSSRG